MRPLYLVVGPSGSGKDTIVNELCKQLNRKKVKSYTTRAKRNPEEDTHIFTDKETFDNLDIVAKTEYHGNYYGATQDQIDEADFYIIDVEGIRYFKKHNRTPRKILTVYISVPERICRQRMLNREDNTTAISRADYDKTHVTKEIDTCKFSRVVPNISTIDTAVNLFKKYIEEVENN